MRGQKTWQQVVTLTDRVDYLANLSNNLVYALAVEKLLADSRFRRRRSGCA